MIEGIPTITVVKEFAVEHNIDMPISEVIYELIYNKITVEEAKKRLMLRSLGPEF